MYCPVCQERLLMTDRQGVEIDYCPKCRGVWLDRGELEKLIEKAQLQSATDYRRDTPERKYDDRESTVRGYEPRRDEYRPDERRYDSHSGYGKPKKRESWLSELFDFD